MNEKLKLDSVHLETPKQYSVFRCIFRLVQECFVPIFHFVKRFFIISLDESTRAFLSSSQLVEIHLEPKFLIANFIQSLKIQFIKFSDMI